MKKMIYVPVGKCADHSCRVCSGSGKMKCPRCDGTGTFTDGSKCYYCQGDTKVKCNACEGTGVIKD